MAPQQTHNFHVPLEKSLYSALRAEAERSGEPATAIAREAIAALVDKRRRDAMAEEISAYARSVAGTSDDLDADLEAASTEELRELE